MVCLLSACTPSLVLEEAAVESQALRPDTSGNPEAPPRFDATEVIERFEVRDAGVVLHYTAAGRNSVPALDVNRDGVPDFVETVGATYQEVLARYHGEWGFRPPPTDALVPLDNGGDGRLDVYLLDFALRADGAFRRECQAPDAPTCTGYLTQENDFAGYGYPSAEVGTRIVSSHEYFHAVQAGYDSAMGVVLGEGTAVWATERFDPSLNDLEHFAPAYLATPERSLDQEPTGPVDGYAYGAGLFFECLAQSRGADSVRELFASLEAGRPWLTVLDELLGADGGTPLSSELERCSDFNLFTGSRARAEYGHRRAEALGEAKVTAADGELQAARVRMFRASSRYWRLKAPGSGAVMRWRPLPEAPDGGDAWIQVRIAEDVPGAPVFQPVGAGQLVALSGRDVFVLVSHVRAGAPSVPLSLCAGSRALVDSCEQAAPDAGTEVDAGEGTSDAGEPPGSSPAPTGCGCSGPPGGATSLFLGATLGALFLRRRQLPWRSTVLVASLLIAVGPRPALAQAGVEASTDAGTSPHEREALALEPDAGEPLPEAAPRSELATIVTGTRLPQRLEDSTIATEVLTRRQIGESGAREVAEALQSRAGIEPFQNVGTTSLRMQGLGPEYNLVLIDGQRTTGRLNGGIDISRLSVEDIEQIEIVKGPSSVMWGSDALAGTINIITRRPNKTLGGSLVGSYGTANQADLQASGEVSRGSWGMMASGGFKRREAYDYDLSTVATTGSSLEQAQGSLRATYGKDAPDQTRADLHVDFTRRAQHGVDGNAAGAVFDRSSRDNILEGQGTLRVPLGRGGLSGHLGAALFDRRYVIDQRESSALDDVQDTRDDNVQLGAQLDQPLGASHVGLLGAELLLERLSSPRLGPGRGDRTRGALFLQDSWTPAATRPFQFVGGVRLDLDSAFGLAVTPRLAARFDPHRAWVLRAVAGSGFRAPSFQELLLNFENPSVGYVVEGNPALRPERSFGSTLSSEWSPSDVWLLSLNLFWNELWDMIGYASITTEELLRFRYVNLSRARTRGLEAMASWVTPIRNITVDAGYTFTDARDLTERLPLEGQASHRWLSQVRFRKREWGLTAQARLSITGPRPYPLDGGTTRWTSPYAALDARVGKTLGQHLALFVAGTNLAGAGNAVDLPIPPRSVFAGLSLQD